MTSARLPLLCRQSSGPRDFCSRVKQQPHPPCHNRRREAEVSVAAVLVLPGGLRRRYPLAPEAIRRAAAVGRLLCGQTSRLVRQRGRDRSAPEAIVRKTRGRRYCFASEQASREASLQSTVNRTHLGPTPLSLLVGLTRPVEMPASVHAEGQRNEGEVPAS
jgi:hypothetical protein